MNGNGVIRRIVLIVVCAAAVVACSASRVVYSTAFSGVDPDADRALNNCVTYCAAHDFDTALDGKIAARVFGIPYTQEVAGGRSVRGENAVEVAESASTLVKAAMKKTVEDGRYFVAKGEYEKKRFVYGDSVELSRGEFVSSYGKINAGLVKYVLEGAVRSSRRVGDNAFEYELDPLRATVYCRNEIKTATSSKNYPTYESVSFTLYTDGERPVKLVARENLRVEKFGGVRCSAEYTEKFTFRD